MHSERYSLQFGYLLYKQETLLLALQNLPGRQRGGSRPPAPGWIRHCWKHLQFYTGVYCFVFLYAVQLPRSHARMTSSFLVVVVFALSVTSSTVFGDVTCPTQCKCYVVSGAPSADCSGRHISELATVVEHLHPDTQV